jgi:hypothetical protein
MCAFTREIGSRGNEAEPPLPPDEMRPERSNDVNRLTIHSCGLYGARCPSFQRLTVMRRGRMPRPGCGDVSSVDRGIEREAKGPKEQLWTLPGLRIIERGPEVRRRR